VNENGARILIVDDDEALLEALPEALRLRMNGIGIDVSATARGALELIREVDYDAIVTDIKLPGMDGLALLTEIKEVRPGTPTLLITGHGEHDLAVQALRGGAYDFVQKPIDRDYFVASLERAIHMRRLDRQVDEQRRELERHARVLQHVDRGVFLVDDAGVIQFWNPAAHAITGLDPEQLVGRHADEALPGWDVVGPEVPIAREPGPVILEAKTLPLEIEGRELWISVSGVRFEDGVVYAFRNLTEERALDELKSDFVATVSHELRTPLAAIYGCARTLLRPDLELAERDRARLLEVVAQESERLTRIVGDILLASQIDAGRLRLKDQEFDVITLVRAVIEEIEASLTGAEGITLELVAPESPTLVSGDEDRLRQVLLNLVDNAVRYSPDGGRVEIQVEPRASGVRIAVCDEGLGISHGEQKRIFSKFYRVDPQQTGGVRGTGLGLYICRELVRRMEGRVSVSSQEGKGSTFVVDLPLLPIGAREQAVATQSA
jgi:two-component system, OmpR family, phosphate regulon sensor histidine kinase PhoR